MADETQMVQKGCVCVDASLEIISIVGIQDPFILCTYVLLYCRLDQVNKLYHIAVVTFCQENLKPETVEHKSVALFNLGSSGCLFLFD